MTAASRFVRKGEGSEKGRSGETAVIWKRTALIVGRRSSIARGIDSWECGNLAFCARFPSPCGNRSVVSMGTPFPQPSSASAEIAQG